jgi:hypothetical protein
MDSYGNPDFLRFPKFHQEILQQKHWEASELLGRIRLVIAEGIVRHVGSPQDGGLSSYELIKDMIVFSFQHAPLRK